MKEKKCPFSRPICNEDCKLFMDGECAEVVRAKALVGIAGLLAQLVKKNKGKKED